MKGARELVNVVMRRYGRGGSKYSVSRIKPAELLFYPSTKEAQAAAPSNDNEIMEIISRMPAPKLRLEHSVAMEKRLDFVPFYGRASGAYRKILCIDKEGRTVLYDTDAGLLHSVPALNGSKGANPIAFSITDKEPRDRARAEALYVMGRYQRCYDYFNFEALMYCDPANSRKGWRWNRLPPPPAPLDTSLSCHALINDDPGREPVLLVSSSTEKEKSGGGGGGTYCFNTYTTNWIKAGSWTLPFVGRVDRVPELDNLWFGIANDRPYEFCAMDLYSMDDSGQAPPLAYSWEDLTLPDDWVMEDCSMVYLGDGKFCVAKIFEFCIDDDDDPTAMGAVISGVEVVRHAEPSSSKLVMVKHKSQFYKFVRDEIQCIL